MREAARLFGQTAHDTDIALVYYAGHGLEVGNQNFLIPIDARLARDLDLEFEAITLASILKVVEGARKLKVVILDACRTNPLGDKMIMPERATRSVGRRAGPDRARRGRVGGLFGQGRHPGPGRSRQAQSLCRFSLEAHGNPGPRCAPHVRPREGCRSPCHAPGTGALDLTARQVEKAYPW